MPRFATIDVGSNTVKVNIADRDEAGQFTPVYGTSRVTRLGEGIHLGRLREIAIRRTIEALTEFADLLREYQVDQVAAVGTSALRDAVNKSELIDRAADLGITLEAIPGEEEARLSFLAVSLDPQWRNEERLLVIDIGGGSTEIIQGNPNGRGIAARTSLPLGAVRLTEAALYSDPPTIQQLEEANQTARRALEGLELLPAHYTPVGVGGTFTNMMAVHMGLATRDSTRIHGARLSLSAVEHQVELYGQRSVEERRNIMGLDPLRADIILGGAIVLNQVLHRIGLESVAICTRGLRWGLMYDRFGV
jgi:exopolyphosphatase/guanosine-5'-triphosphate,3'-diphosphate pyrophosphatase